MNDRLTRLLQCDDPWKMCTLFGVHNMSVNIGVRDSLKTRVLDRNSSLYFNGCPCHILHNAAQKAGDAFAKCCRFDAEKFIVDLFYWFDKSTKEI